MRVLHLTRDFPPHITGGLSTAAGGLIRTSQAEGIDCAVVSFDGWRPVANTEDLPTMPAEKVDGTEVWRVLSEHQAVSAIADAGRWRPDLVHVHHGMLWDFSGALGGLPRCFTTHVLQRELNRLRATTAPTMSLVGQEKALATADAVITPSAAAEKILCSDYPDLAPRLHRIGFGVTPAPPRDDEPPASLPCALYVGRFSDVKGTAELFECIPGLLDADQALRVVVAGGNPEGRKSERRWLRRFERTVAEAFRSRVEFTGWVAPETLANLHRRARVLLCPSWFETFGLAALEAMAHGVPVVGTTGGALPELVDHGRTGLLAPPRDVETFARHAIRLLTDVDLARSMGEAAARAARAFSWTDVVQRHFEVYRSIA